MLARAGTPPVGPGWAFEFKWDGVRAVVAAAGETVQPRSRNGNDITTGYPELVRLPAVLDGRAVLLDGEIVALDEAGRPDFGLLQHRMHVRAPGAELLARTPVAFYVFDLLHLDGLSLLAESWDRRRDLLEQLDLERAAPTVRVPASHTGVAGSRLLDIARSHGLEGIVAKRRSARYEPGRRSSAWIKTALLNTQEAVIGGWSPGEGRRAATLGSLLLGAYDDKRRLRYLGQVGTGFTERMLTHLLEQLRPLRQADSPFDEPVPRDHARRACWVAPRLVGEVEYRTWTPDGRLRHAAWRGLRGDKSPGDVRHRPA
ncbi:DNA ligase [Pseudonocardia sp. K10HN5]|uniref:DNA ligase (ATP) n=2 Tax=Pseudonocardia acidicola TaxID=2724939 RepID=A0ABX1SHS2_9PSEU|nr:DNA ligase [Pseudonocardia acidicola]